MGAFGGLIITNKGRALQAKAQTGIELTYTRIKVGDGKLGGQSILTLNDLISVKKSLDILKLEARPGGKAVVGSMLSNAGLKSGFYFREIGVFAQDPDEGEVLYCYANAGDNAEYIPPEGGPDVIEKYINAVTIIQNAQNVSAVIDSSLVYPTNKEMEVAIKEYFDANNNAKILPAMSFKASDVGTLYPKGMSIFWLDRGIDSGWPADNGQVVTWYTAGNRLNQIFFETDVRSQRVWSRRWSSTSAIWSDFRELETTVGSAEKVAQALEEAKAYTDEKAATIDAPVKSVNGKTGDVVLTSDDVGAAQKDHKHDASDISTGTLAAARLPSATTGAKGAVQLSDAVNSTSTSLAATANAVKKAYDRAEQAFQSGVDAKNQIVGAINSKGGNASTNDSWATLAAAITGLQQAKGDLAQTSAFFDMLGGYKRGTFINKANNFIFVKGGWTSPSSGKYQLELHEVASNGTIVRKVQLGDTRDVSADSTLVGDDVVLIASSTPGTYELYDHTGKLISKNNVGYSNTWRLIAITRDGSNTFIVYGGYRDTESVKILNHAAVPYFTMPDGSGSSFDAVFLSKTKLYVARDDSSPLGRKHTIITRNNLSFSYEMTNQSTGVSDVINFLGAHAYR